MNPLHERIERGFAPVARAVASGAIPGGVLGLVDRDGNSEIRHAGHAVLQPERAAMSADTWFDLASLTKVIFTTTAILRLADQGRLHLDAPLSDAIPDLRQYDVANAPERRLTFRQCLSHQTHLPAVEPIYTYGTDPQTLRAFILQRAWQPLATPVYSDINFMLLGIAIERLTGLPLPAQPLGPELSFTPLAARCAATEACTWRGRVLRGEVHDENAFALGGAAGHAGLFGTAAGVLGFARAVLDGTALSPAGLAAIRSAQGPRRTVGWERPYEGWSGGETCSADTIGHLGFTGTGLWIDFDAGLAWTLLTNRVHPSRHTPSGIVALRRETSRAVLLG